MSAEWQLTEDQRILGCVVTCSADFGSNENERIKDPYLLVARFRLLYEIKPGVPLEAADLNQFANWNAVFNIWPYWREHLASVIGSANLPQFTLPILGFPLALTTRQGNGEGQEQG
ncbi:MAG: hypothetical protein WBQ14_08255 [Gaiellaceae bacterium]